MPDDRSTVRHHRRQWPISILALARKHDASATGLWRLRYAKKLARSRVETLAWRCHWISIGELGKLIDICKAEAVTEIMMAGQVKHARIFLIDSARIGAWSSCLPPCGRRNTSALIGGVAKVLADEEFN